MGSYERKFVDIINQKDSAANEGSNAKLGSPSISVEKITNFGDNQLWFIQDLKQNIYESDLIHLVGSKFYPPVMKEKMVRTPMIMHIEYRILIIVGIMLEVFFMELLGIQY